MRSLARRDRPTLLQRLKLRLLKSILDVNFGTQGAETWEYAYRFAHGQSLSGGDPTDWYEKHSVVALAFETIALDAAAVSWELFPEGSEDPLEKHPLLDLWANPNQVLKGMQTWIFTYLVRQVFGECFWYYPDLVLGTGQGALASGVGEIEFLDPRAVRTKIDRRTKEVSWTLQQHGEEVPLDPEFLTQFKRMNPRNPLRGLSKIEALILEISGDYAASAWNERFFSEQNAIPSGVLIPAQGSNLTPDQRTEMIRTWSQRHGSGKRSLAITPPGWSFEALGLTQTDMSWGELRGTSREYILGFIGVPPFMAGVLDKANYANAREQKSVYWQGTITRFLGEIQNTLQHDFLPKVGLESLKVKAKMEVVRALAADLAQKVETARGLWQMGVPLEEINTRLELGLSTDDIEGADTGWLPLGVQPVSFALEEPEPAPAVPPALPPAEDEEEEDAEEEEEKALSVTDVGREQRRTLLWRAAIGIQQRLPLERALNRVIRSHTKALAVEVAGNLQGARGWLATQKQDTGELFDMDRANKNLRRRTTPLHTDGVRRGGNSVYAHLTTTAKFDMTDPRVVAHIQTLGFNLVRPGRGYNYLLQERLQTILAEQFAASATIEQMRDAIANEFAVTLGRSRTWAMTETGFALNGGRHTGMQQAGIKRQEWLSSRDPDVRDSHFEEDGNRIDIGGTFPVTGLLYPQEPGGPPGEVINCRCVAIPVTQE